MSMERGSLTLEAVLLAPVVMLLLVFIVSLARIADTSSIVTAAARSGAQQAAIAPDASAAEATGTGAALGSLESHGTPCRSPSVIVSTAAFRPGGEVQVTVRCTVSISELGAPLIPGSLSLHASVSAPIDPYRVVQ